MTPEAPPSHDPLNIAETVTHILANNWITLLVIAIVIVKLLLLRQSCKLIAAGFIDFIAFVIHHGTSIFRRLSVLLRLLAAELREADKQEKLLREAKQPNIPKAE